MKVKLSNEAQELLTILCRRMNKHPPDFLNEIIAMTSAGYYSLDSILPERACDDPRKVLAVVKQLPEGDHSVPISVELPAELTGSVPMRAHRVPLD